MQTRVYNNNNRMFWGSVESKASKIKLNVEGYLSDKKKESAAPAQPSSSRQQPPHQITNALAQNLGHSSQPQPVSHAKPIEIDIKSLTIQGKTFEKGPNSMKNMVKEKSVTIFYIEEHMRYKLEIRALENVGTIEVHIYPERNQLEISFKKAGKFKYFKQDNGEPKWMIHSEIKDEKIVMVCNKDPKSLKAYF